MTREETLEKLLLDVLKAWRNECDQGDGIHENDVALYEKAKQLVDKEPEPEIKFFKERLVRTNGIMIVVRALNKCLKTVTSFNGNEIPMDRIEPITFPDVAFSIRPEWAMWIAQDYDGLWGYYESEPETSDRAWGFSYGRCATVNLGLPNNPDWRKAKQKRPEYL